MKCSQDPIRDLCSEKCPLLLACGHVCQNQCNEPCTTSCKVLVDHENIADCGHSFKIECNLSAKGDGAHFGNSYELLKFCDYPCKETLSCDHICSGTCGECAQGRIHKQCAEKCGAVLVCGHPCLVGCREDCQPCSEKCSYKCVHSACTKKCGDPCTACKEQCARKCVHVACSSLCGAICTVPPCNEACDKILPCGHDCVGFCGDPCPPLCRVCDDDELTEIFFGDEDEVDAKFVVLDECGHVFESKGMDLWMRDEDNRGKIAPKCCPRCKTIITSTRRYSDYVKQTLKNLCAVKEKFAGTDKDRKQKSDELLDKINNLEENNLVVKEPMLEKLLQRITNAIIRVKNGRRQNVDLMQLTVYSAKVQIIENIIVATDKREVTSKILKDHLKFLLYMLSRNDKKLSKQEIADFNKEVKRWSFLVQITDIQDFFWIDRLRNDESFIRTFENCKKILFSIKIFSESLQEEVVANLDFLNEKFELKTAIIEFKIVKAMGMAKGHWFRCPNGHIYAIGECGGATQVGKCVDCKENIGGSGHRLLENNTHAREIDGSNFPAYSEEANNLGNYENLF
ncbi:hypothetical protein FQR65_LT12271 [Abscondita terminalis]|nr:hypothetical protein FQR65_LT12271 [Abscondita terminalis]